MPRRLAGQPPLEQMEPDLSWPATLRVERPDGRAFTLEDPDGRRLRVAVGGAWEGDGRRLEVAEGSPGFVLRSAEGEELGRTTREPDAKEGTGAADLIVEDGRVFRIGTRVGRDPRIELTGWETPGAYLEARFDGESWRIDATPAGLELERTGGIIVLMAAEIAAVDVSG